MIFVSECGFRAQLDLLSFVSKGLDFEAVIWMYPESKYSHLNGLDLNLSSDVEAESATEYANGDDIKCTDRLVVNDELFGMLWEKRRMVSKHCSGICLYLPGEREWQACSIGHEDVALVRDENYMPRLISAGYNATLNAPAWW